MLTYLSNLGVAFDMWLNAILGGLPGQTISMRSALAQKAGKRWGCVVCRLLSWLVQRDHCEDQLLGMPTPELDQVKAAVGLLILYWIVMTPIRLLCQLFEQIIP